MVFGIETMFEVAQAYAQHVKSSELVLVVD